MGDDLAGAGAQALTDAPDAWSLKEALALASSPFAAWFGLSQLWKFFGLRRKFSSDDKKTESQERDKMRAGLDTAQAAYLDRIERSNAAKDADIIRLENEKRRISQTLELERDIALKVAQEQEEEAYDARHDHVRDVQAFNSMLLLLRRCIAGTLSPEAAEEVSKQELKVEPARPLDVRSKVRMLTAAAMRTAAENAKGTGT